MMCLSNVWTAVSPNSGLSPTVNSEIQGQVAIDDPKPQVLWALTRACNLRRCHYCDSFIRQVDPSQELSYHQGLALLDDLALMGVDRLILTGGEPLCRPDMPELMGYAISLGLSCQVQTNAMMLNDAMADRLAGLGLKDIYVSIDGMRHSHDKLRNQNGAFARTTEGINHAVARGMQVTVRFAIHQLNDLDLESVFDYCLAHSVRRLVVQHTSADWSPGAIEAMDHRQTRHWVSRLMNLTRRSIQAGRNLEVATLGNHADAALLLIEMQQQNADPIAVHQAKAILETHHRHELDQTLACIDSMGRISCLRDGQHQPIGDLNQAPLSRWWSDPQQQAFRRQYLQKRLAARQCRTCPYFSCCGGNCQTIRHQVAIEDARLIRADPWCYLEPHERQMAA